MNKIHKYKPQVEEHRYSTVSEFLRSPVSPFLKYGYSLTGDFGNISERWASHVRGWLNAPDTLIVRYEDLKLNYKTVLNKISGFLGIKIKKRTHPVGMRDAGSVFPRKGIIGDWKEYFCPKDEVFLREVIQSYGLDWNQMIFFIKTL